MSRYDSLGHDGLVGHGTSLAAALAAQFGGKALDYLVTDTGVYRRRFFDFTTADAQDWSGHTVDTWTNVTLVDQSGNNVSAQAYYTASPTTWGIVASTGLRNVGTVRGGLRFTPAQLGIDLGKHAFYLRWGATREQDQVATQWAGIRFEPSSGTADFLRLKVDTESGGNFVGHNVTRRSSSDTEDNTLHSSASGRTSFLQEVFFCRGAFKDSATLDGGTTRPADVNALTEYSEGSHENRGITLDAADYDIAYLQFKTTGDMTVPWIEVLIALSEYS